jgi:hypothetical protein
MLPALQLCPLALVAYTIFSGATGSAPQMNRGHDHYTTMTLPPQPTAELHQHLHADLRQRTQQS